MQEMEERRTQRATVKRSITNLKNYVFSKAETLSEHEVQCRLEILDSYWKLLLTHQAALEKLAPDDETIAHARSDLEDLYCETKVKLLSLKSRSGTSTTELNTTTVVMPGNKFNLPPLKLPQYSGKYSEFPNFISIFNKLVNDDPEKSVTEKYSHLRNCLVGQALQTIESLGKSSDNYYQALERLKERYDNKHLMFQEHISEIFEMQKVSKGIAIQLRKLVDGISSHLCALRILGSNEDITNSLIIHIVMSKLDIDTQIKWEEAVDYSRLPSWKDCEKVLNRRCQFLESREHRAAINLNSNQQSSRTNWAQPNRKQTSLKVTTNKCSHCESSEHRINQCKRFAALTVNERFEHVKRNCLCINCLKKGHGVKQWTASKCTLCLRPHHTLLHRSVVNNSLTKFPNAMPREMLCSAAGAGREGDTFKLEEPRASLYSSKSVLKLATNHILLGTAIIRIQDCTGKFQIARALLDSGSQQNFITEDLSNKLRLNRKFIDVSITGIGDKSTNIRHEVQATIKSRINEFENNITMWVLPRITGCQPDEKIDISQWEIPKNIALADPNFNIPQSVDLLIGAEIFFDLLCVGQIKMGPDIPVLQKTMWGWIMSGKLTTDNKGCLLTSIDNNVSNDMNLNKLVEKFWEIDEPKLKLETLSEEEMKCEQIFSETITETTDGRLKVIYPLKGSPMVLGNSFDIAKRRFLSLEKRLMRNPRMKLEYSKFVSEYMATEHMELVDPLEIPSIHYYLPHHAIETPKNSSTKLRVVFDASCKTSSNISLNDIMMVGPTVQDDLFSILIRFRWKKYALIADITKMFRQILVREDQTNLQLILWREDVKEDLQHFRLKTLTYGVASTPFLATRCINYLADKYAEKFKKAATVLKEYMYIDNLLTGSDNGKELIELQTQVNTIMKSAKLEMHKWYSNCPEVLRSIPEVCQEKLNLIGEREVIHTLGITWEPKEDYFSYTHEFTAQNNRKVTKRTVLSEMSKLFDPLGLINPLIVTAKLYFQELWILKIPWDESLPMQLHQSWIKFFNDLRLVGEISIPRLVVTPHELREVEIHGFSDASLRAYGACIYIRSIDRNGDISVHLMTARSKVAPAKRVRTLPCLELCGAELLAKLLDKVKRSLRYEVQRIILWTDSQIVLGWLDSHPSQWKIFVSNRVSTINQLTENIKWRYVPSKDNPADMVSGGASIEELSRSRWFVGPTFLQRAEEHWPQWKRNITKLPERKEKITTLLIRANSSLLDYIYNISSFTKIRRIMGYILRYINNCRTKKTRGRAQEGTLTATELEHSLTKLIWMIQQTEFSDEIKVLKRDNTLQVKTLKALNPFIEESDILRVGGRLHHADLPYCAKSPILLPKNNPFVKIFVKHLHVKHLHAGPQTLAGIIRQRYWIVNCRDYCRKIVNSCIHCFRYKPKLMNQIMGNLPPERLKGSVPFATVGIDFCGPVMITQRIRGKPSSKAYIAVFVCFLSKGVHLETVSDLTSEAFIAAFKRFIARRNLCKYIFCDNATNFVGARRKLAQLQKAFFQKKFQENIKEWLAEQDIEFRHIPPRSPHFGGIWEAAVKSANYHLYRTINHAVLTFEELTTICCQIEAILNSSPIVALSNDPNDEQALTPAHFWCHAPLNTILEPDISEHLTSMSYIKRWRQITMIQQHFWRRWSKEYLSTLQKRHKWQATSPNLMENQLVLISEDNLPPQKWLLARVIKLHRGIDGKVRVADLRIKGNTVRRAIHKLALLPSYQDIDNPIGIVKGGSMLSQCERGLMMT